MRDAVAVAHETGSKTRAFQTLNRELDARAPDLLAPPSLLCTISAAPTHLFLLYVRRPALEIRPLGWG